MSVFRFPRSRLVIGLLAVLFSSVIQLRLASAEQPRIILAECKVKNFNETQAKFHACSRGCSNRYAACLNENRSHGKHSNCLAQSDQCGLDCQATFHPWVTAKERRDGCR